MLPWLEGKDEKCELDAEGKWEPNESEENGYYYLLCFGWGSMEEQAGRVVGTHIIFVPMSRICVCYRAFYIF